MDDSQQSLILAFANHFRNGELFGTIVEARNFASSILNEKVVTGTLAAKLVDESIEQGVVWASRGMVMSTTNYIQAWEQCLDLYNRQPVLNTRTSTSVL